MGQILVGLAQFAFLPLQRGDVGDQRCRAARRQPEITDLLPAPAARVEKDMRLALGRLEGAPARRRPFAIISVNARRRRTRPAADRAIADLVMAEDRKSVG